VAKTIRSFWLSLAAAVAAAPLGVSLPTVVAITFNGLLTGDRSYFDTYGLALAFYTYGLPVALVGALTLGAFFYHFAEKAKLRKLRHYATAGVFSGTLLALLVWALFMSNPSSSRAVLPVILTVVSIGASGAFVAAAVFWYLHIRPLERE
jgi:hypothetical protein